MKAIRRISIAVMILAAGTAGIQAQKSTRTETRRANSSTAVKQNTPRSAQVRSTSKQPAQKQSVQRKAVHQNRTAQNNTTKKPVSVSTRRNPNSDYRSMKTHRTAGDRNYKQKRYYSGHHYHNVYPNKHVNVKVHHHYDTYHHHYRVLYMPHYREIIWNRNMYNYYTRWYPNYHWNYHYGYRIRTISIFEAKYNLGEVSNVYGRVYGTWYNRESDDYLLFFGGEYPYQQFTVVVPGNIARRYSRKPARFFPGEHISITGLITTYNGIPEIIVKNRRQLDLY